MKFGRNSTTEKSDDLLDISDGKHEALARTLLDHGKRERIYPKKLLQLIEQAVASGNIDAQRLNPGIQKKITKRPPHLPDR